MMDSYVGQANRARALRLGRRLVVYLVLTVAASLVVLLALQNRALRREVVRLEVEARFPHAGLVVPTFRAATLDGDTVTIGQSAGAQVLFVLSASCPFCLETLPAWKAIAAELEGGTAAVGVYGISLDAESEARRYAAQHSFSFPLLQFPDPKLAKLYRARGTPTTLVLDGQGEVIHARIGAFQARAVVDSILTAVRQVGAADEASEQETLGGDARQYQ